MTKNALQCAQINAESVLRQENMAKNDGFCGFQKSKSDDFICLEINAERDLLNLKRKTWL